MFSDNLSEHILQILSSKELSYESAAELCDMSPRHLGNIVRRCTVPSVAMLEKICRGLNATPNGLLLPGPAHSEPGPRPLRLLAVQAVRGINGFICRPLCPGCEIRSEYEQPNRCALCQFRPAPAPGTALLLLPGGD